jgi:membrane-bound lytic murein transglycosylase B
MPEIVRPPEPVHGRHRRRRARSLVAAMAAAAVLAPGLAGGVEPDDDGDRVRDQAATGAARAATSAAPLTPAALALPAPGLPGLPRTSVELTGIEVDSAAFRRAEGAYAGVEEVHRTARDLRRGLDTERSVLESVSSQLAATQRSGSARAAAAARRLAVIEAAISDLVVSSYVGGAGSDRITAALADPTPAVNDAERRAVLAAASLETLLAEREHLVAVRDAAEHEAASAAEGMGRVRVRILEIAEERREAEAAEVARGEDLARERVAYEEARVLASVVGVDFPLVALDAYHRAAGAMGREQPGCGIRWWALAGISRVEGRHGTYGGSSLAADGQTTRRIIGIPLNGENETMAIPDTDGGALDGDPVWDRAVGPMQFIPSTWRRFAADGTGNGVADPHNLYDATLAAARYLCRSSGSMASDDGMRRGFIAYNRSTAYVERVLGLARGYERALEVPDPHAG